MAGYFCFLINDFAFYVTHSFLHWGPMYKKIHKVHHENKVTFSLATEYAHPHEYILGNIIAFNIGQLILGKKMHLITNCIINSTNTIGAIQNHSGFTFPWLPFHFISKYCKSFTTPDL
jgi:sterol desaturase/sphingolipid hydroxylase (fatty acid hydroxylase superfamily)